MPTLEELLEQKTEIEERKFKLEKYQSELRKIQVQISEITYRQNSGIWIDAEQTQRKDSLKKELRSKITGLKLDYQLTPHHIPAQISRYESCLTRIVRQIDDIEKIPEEQQRLKGLENRTTGTDIQLLAEQTEQQASTRHRHVRSSDALPSYDDVYEIPKGQHAGWQHQGRSRDDDRDR